MSDQKGFGKSKGKGQPKGKGKGKGPEFDPRGAYGQQQMPYAMPYASPSMGMYGAPYTMEGTQLPQMQGYGMQPYAYTPTAAFSPGQPVPGWNMGAPSPYEKVWETFFDEHGTPYYYHKVTGLTQWEMPPELMGELKFDNKQNLFVFHLPNGWKDEDLHKQFSNYGKVVSAKVMIEPEKNRSRGFGFVAYASESEAHNAIAKANGLPVQGKRLKVELKKHQEETKGMGKGKGSKGPKGKGKGKGEFTPKGGKGGDSSGRFGKGGEGGSPRHESGNLSPSAAAQQ